MTSTLDQLLPPDSAPSPLADKVAVVIGGAGGIGLPLAAELQRLGCQMVIAGRSAESVAKALERVPGARGHAPCDVRDAASVAALFASVLEHYGRVDIVVNCAGIGRSSSARAVPTTTARLEEAHWNEVVDTNLRGSFLVARAAAQAMIPRKQGQIINISSARGARRGQPFGAAYCASKMAALSLFQALAEELQPLGIRAWSLLPDAVDTALIAGTQLAARGSMLAAGLAEVIAGLAAAPAEVRWHDPLVAPFAAAVEPITEAALG